MASALTVTSLEGLESVDQRLATQYEAMTAQIRQRLSPDHAALFARPEPALEEGRLAWFVEDDSEAVPLSDLAEEDRELALRQLRKLEADLKTLIRELNRGGPDLKALAGLIANALVRPSDDCVWVVDGKLVLVNWGFREAGRQTMPRSAGIVVADAKPVVTTAAETALAGVAAPAGGGQTPPGPEVRPGARRRLGLPLSPLLWALFVLLLGVSAWQLLKACALFGTGLPEAVRWLGPNECPTVQRADDRGLERTVAGLRRAIAADERILMAKVAQCQTCPVPPESPAPEPTPPPAPKLDQLDRQALERGGCPTGVLQVTLQWHTEDDVDLIARCPNGTVIGGPDAKVVGGGCGDGNLTIDANKNLTTNITKDPIEQICWNENLPDGKISFSALLYKRKNQDTRVKIPVQIRMKLDQETRTCTDSVIGIPKSENKKDAKGIIGGYYPTFTWAKGLPLPDCSFSQQPAHYCEGCGK